MTTPQLPRITNSKTRKFLEEFFAQHPVRPNELSPEAAAQLRADFKAGLRSIGQAPMLWEKLAMCDYLTARWLGTPAASDFYHTGNAPAQEEVLCSAPTNPHFK